MKARDRIRALEAHLIKAHESEDRATQAAERAEARLAEAERDRAMWHRIVRDHGLCDCDPAGRESGVDAERRKQGSPGSVPAAANPGGVTLRKVIRLALGERPHLDIDPDDEKERLG